MAYNGRNMQKRKTEVLVIEPNGNMFPKELSDKDRAALAWEDYDLIFPRHANIAVMRLSNGTEMVFGFDPESQKLTSISAVDSQRIAGRRNGYEKATRTPNLAFC